MANLPEKNVVLVDKITNVPTDSNLFINANGEFKQASVNDVVNSSTVVSTAVETAINTAVQDSIDSNFKQTSGSPILLTDTADGTLIDFKGKGRSTQNGTPTPDSPIAIKSVADGGYFDGELLQGYYSSSTGDFNSAFVSSVAYVCNKNIIPCQQGDKVMLMYGEIALELGVFYWDKDYKFISKTSLTSANKLTATAPANTSYLTLWVNKSGITPQTAKHITVTINGKYALIVKSKGKNLFNAHNLVSYDTANGSIDIDDIKGTITLTGTYYHGTSIEVEPNTDYYLNYYVESQTANDQVSIWDDSASELLKMSSGLFNSGNCTKIRIYLYSGKDTSGTTVYKNFQFERNTVATDYEPYKETVSYIPLNEPLRSSLDGTVTDEVSLSENKVTRRIVRKRIVTVSKNDGTDVNNYCYYYPLGNVGRSNRGMSNNLPNLSTYEVSINGTENIGQCVSVEYGGVVYINVGKHLTENTVEGMTKWLSENPTYIQYELAEPITETIEPVDIVTYDNVTYLTASDNAEMELEYPTSKVAGIASIGYSKGRKAEYEVELLKAQLLELQTAMVNSL